MTEKIKSESTLEHLLRQPDNYIGSKQITDEEVFLVKDGKIVRQKISDFSEALIHIFKEVIDNAADNISREWTHPQTYIKVEVTSNSVKVTNDGKPIPIIQETIELPNEITKKKEKITLYRTQALFNYFRTGTNAEKSETLDTVGVNGTGTKAVIGVSKFAKIVHCDPDTEQQLEIVWKNNMSVISDPKIKSSKSKSFTTFYYEPDFKWFGLEKFSDNHIGIMHCMTMCLAYLTGIKVTFNDTAIKIPNIVALGKLFFGGDRKSMELTNAEGDKVLIMEQTLDEMEEFGLRSLSFMNRTYTRKDGIHVGYNANKIGKEIADVFGAPLKQDDAKKFFIYVVDYKVKGKMEWSGQTKASFLGPTRSFKRIDFEKKDVNKLKKWNVWNEISTFLQGKINRTANKTTKTSNVSYIGSLGKEGFDAHYAGTKERSKTELYLTEGLSAKSLIEAGFKYRKSSQYIGILALRGKINNVQKMDRSKQADAKFLALIRKMIGLKMGCKYMNQNEIDDLRYPSVIIATDKDHDGRHILGLVYSFFQIEHPGLIENGVVSFLETPVIKTTIGKEVHRFYLREDFTEWLETLSPSKKATAIKNRHFIKGLGGNSEGKDVAFIFKDNYFTGHLTFKKQKDKDLLEMFFGKENVKGKKEFMAQTFYNDEWVHLPKKGDMTFSEYIEHVFTPAVDEQIHRAIPYVYDGLIESKKEILWTALHYLKSQMKTVQFASSVATHSGYDHGEQNLPPTVTKMSQNIIGQNNIIVFKPDGIFGNRYQDSESHHGASAERYTYVSLQPLMRSIFMEDDDPILEYEEKDGFISSPKYFLPIVPWFAINGILTTVANTYSTAYPSYNPLDLVEWIRAWISRNFQDEEKQVSLKPWFRGFQGTIEKEGNGWISKGICNQENKTTWKIDEIAVGKWGCQMQALLEKLADEKLIAKPCIINENKNSCKAVITVKSPFNVLKRLETVLTRKMPMTNVTLIHEKGPVTFDNIEDHLEEYAQRRYKGYIDRRKFQIAKWTKDLQIKTDKIRYIKLVLDGVINFKKIKDREHLITILEQNDFKAVDEKWDHLTDITMLAASQKSIERLEAEKQKSEEHYKYYKESKPWKLWLDDLDKFIKDYEIYCKQNPMDGMDE